MFAAVYHEVSTLTRGTQYRLWIAYEKCASSESDPLINRHSCLFLPSLLHRIVCLPVATGLRFGLPVGLRGTRARRLRIAVSTFGPLFAALDTRLKVLEIGCAQWYSSGIRPNHAAYAR